MSTQPACCQETVMSCPLTVARRRFAVAKDFLVPDSRQFVPDPRRFAPQAFCFLLHPCYPRANPTMQTKQLTPLLLAACVALPSAALASGTYSARPPRPPVKSASGEKLDSAKYDLGKRIYTGKAKLEANTAVPMATQETRLRALEARL